MKERLLPLTLLGLGLAWSAPVFADVADDTSTGEEEEESSEEGDDHDHDEDHDDDDKGCSHAAVNPVTGLSLVVGVGLVLGLRRRT